MSFEEAPESEEYVFFRRIERQEIEEVLRHIHCLYLYTTEEPVRLTSTKRAEALERAYNDIAQSLGARSLEEMTQARNSRQKGDD